MGPIPVTRIFPRDPGVAQAADLCDHSAEKPDTYAIVLAIEGNWSAKLVVFTPNDGSAAREKFSRGGQISGLLRVPGVEPLSCVLSVAPCGLKGSLIAASPSQG